MSVPTKTRQWTLNKYPTNLPTYGSSSDTFTLAEHDIPALQDGQILVQSLYLSNDPAQRGWIAPPSQIDPKRLYVPPVKEGEAMRTRGLAKVISSKNSDYKEGDLIQGNVNWVEYPVLDASDPKQGVRKIQEIPGLSVTHYLGALGGTGLTAWYGFTEIVGGKKGDRVVVSGAAGATGSMVVQIAKHIVGASYVVGIAGNDEKCRWVESLGADKCLNYKDKDFTKQLKEACGDGVDVYFDNVGGEILDSMLANMAQNELVEQEPKQQDEQPKMNDDDEMAATAGRLLERVADNTSEKFQNSQFLELMRRLRDREVRVEGDKMVEVNDQAPHAAQSTEQTTVQPSATQSSLGQDTATPIPGIDPQILDHAATDFELPTYYETSEITTPTRHTTGEQQSSIPASEQDDDRWRYALPGRDPVVKQRGG